MTSTTTKQIRSTDARAATLRAEIDRLFAQPGKHRLKQNEALDIVAKMDGSRNHHVVDSTAANDAHVARDADTQADGTRRAAFTAEIASLIRDICATMDEGDDHCANEVAQFAMADVTTEMANDRNMDRLDIVMRNDEGRVEVIAWNGASCERSQNDLAPARRQRRKKSIRQTLRALTEDGQTTSPWMPGQSVVDINGAWTSDGDYASRRSVIDQSITFDDTPDGSASDSEEIRVLLLVEVNIPLEEGLGNNANMVVLKGDPKDSDRATLRWLRSGKR